jgi:3-oxoacyl-[acyl-carrier protein] reductase
MDGFSVNLSGRVALVTGGSRGIGAATVRLLRASGARTVFSYRAAEQQAQALAAECGGAEYCVALKQELRSPTDGRALVENASRVFGRLDCLIVNHGIWPSHDAPIAAMNDAQWSETLGVNLDSVFGLVRAMVSQLEAQQQTFAQRGHIVLISSTAGQRGEAFHADYAVTKGALISMTKSLSSELAPRGILVNCVAPGWVATEMSAAALKDPVRGPQIASVIPVGRAGQPEEIAGPVVFLCSPHAGFISGEVLNVNGGAVLVG